MKKHLRITVDGEEYEVIVEEVDQHEEKGSTEPETKPATPRPTTKKATPRPQRQETPAPEKEQEPEPEPEPEIQPSAPEPHGDKGDTPVEAPLAGTVKGLPVKVGDLVSAGDTVVLLEALKLENEITSPADGEVATIEVTEGSNVENGQVLMTINTQ